jgi:hypothetical protein
VVEKAGLECHLDGGEGVRGGYPSEHESTDEEVEKEELTLPPPSQSAEALPPFGDILSRQMGITVGVHQSRWT